MNQKNGPIMKLVTSVDYVPAANPDARIARPVLIGLDTIQRKEIVWTWRHRIQRDAINLVVGQPGCGKTMWVADAAARITRGIPWPDGSPCHSGSVLIANAEDDPETVLGPRFDAAGVDSSRVKLIDCIRSIDADGRVIERGFTLDELDKLNMACDEMPDCAALFIDPMGSFIGGKVDSHRDNEVRAVLTPLARLARDRKIAVIIVVHTRKSTGGGADERALGSRAFVGAAQCVQHLVWHPDQEANKGVRCLLPGKANNAPPTDGIAFTVQGDPPAVEWLAEPVKMTADEAYGKQDAGPDLEDKPGPEPVKHDAAKSFLTMELQDGPVLVKKLMDDAKQAGVTVRTLRRAADDLQVIREKLNGFGAEGGWQWRFPRDGDGRPVVPELPSPDATPPNTLELGHLATIGASAPKINFSPVTDPIDGQVENDAGHVCGEGENHLDTYDENPNGGQDD